MSTGGDEEADAEKTASHNGTGCKGVGAEAPVKDKKKQPKSKMPKEEDAGFDDVAL